MGHYPHEGYCPFHIHAKDNPVRVGQRIPTYPKDFPLEDLSRGNSRSPPWQSPSVGEINWGSEIVIRHPLLFIVEWMGIVAYQISVSEHISLINPSKIENIMEL